MALIKCPECGKDISDKASTCPNCGHPISPQQTTVNVTQVQPEKKEKKKGSCLTKIIGFVVVIIIIGVIASSGSKDDNKTKTSDAGSSTATTEKSTSEEAETTEEPEYINVTSTELIDAYNDNQVSCKQNYDGKLLAVTGKVESVGTDIMNQTYVCLGHDTDYTFVGIQCFTKDDDQIAKIAELSEGDTITVYGTGECGSLSFSLNDITIQ